MGKYIFANGGENDDAYDSTDAFNAYADEVINQQQYEGSDNQEAAPSDNSENSDFINNLRSYDAEQSSQQSQFDLEDHFNKLASSLEERIALMQHMQKVDSWFEDSDGIDEVADMYNTQKYNMTDMYEMNPVAGRPMGSLGKASSQDAQTALNYFINKGYPKHVAAGIVANIQHESGFNPNATGDNGQAKGYAQWHPDRYKALSQKFNLGTPQGNLDAIDYELHNTEKNALSKIMQASSPSEAAALVDQHYERSAGLTRNQRMQTANNLYK